MPASVAIQVGLCQTWSETRIVSFFFHAQAHIMKRSYKGQTDNKKLLCERFNPSLWYSLPRNQILKQKKEKKKKVKKVNNFDFCRTYSLMFVALLTAATGIFRSHFSVHLCVVSLKPFQYQSVTSLRVTYFISFTKHHTKFLLLVTEKWSSRYRYFKIFCNGRY